MNNLKKLTALLLALLMVLALAACGGGSSDADSASKDEAAPVADGDDAKAEEESPEVDCINMENETGIIKYVRFEKANSGLTSNDNDYVFVFEFTNKKDAPDEVQHSFYISFFQNGVELDNSTSYSSNGGDQYELVGAFFNEALKGGTVTFGKIASPKDDSPITVMVRNHDDDKYQTMVVDLKDTSSGAAASDNAAADMSADEVEEALQGTWALQNSNFFTFEDGKISIVTGGTTMNGTYKVNTDSCNIDAELVASNGNVTIHMPYGMEGDTFTVYNNQNEALVKQA